MAVRLNVIMVSRAPPIATAQHVAESIVGELIGLAGIDLALVDRLDQIQPTSTDFLTLDSLAGDVAVLDWQAAEATARMLTQLGFEGSRARHAHDLEATNSDHSRRIYAYDLSKFDDAGRVISALRELLSTRQVRTFSLDGMLPNRPHPRAAGQPVAKGSERPNNAKTADPDNLPHPAIDPPTESTTTGPRGPQKTLDLDELVDQLDSLDLQ